MAGYYNPFLPARGVKPAPTAADVLDDEITGWSQRKSDAGRYRAGVKQQIDDFLSKEGTDLFERGIDGKLLSQPDGTYVPKLGLEVDSLRSKTQQKTGLIRAAFSGDLETGDPTPEAVEAQKRLGEIEPRYQLTKERYDRLQAELDRAASLENEAETGLGRLAQTRLQAATITPDDVMRTVAEVNAGRTSAGIQPVRLEDLAPKPQPRAKVQPSPDVLDELAANRTGGERYPSIQQLTAQQTNERQRMKRETTVHPARAPVGRAAITGRDLDARATDRAVKSGMDPQSARLLELASFRAQGVSAIDGTPISDLIAASGGEQTVANATVLETMKRINKRIASIDQKFGESPDESRARALTNEREVLQKLAAGKQALIDQIPTSERIKSALGSVLGGVAEIPAATLDFIAITAKKIDDALPAWALGQHYQGKEVDDLQTAIWARQIREGVQGLAPADPRLQQEFWSARVPNAIGSMLAFLGATAMTKSPVVTPLVLGGATGGSAGYREAIDAGADEETALTSMLLNTGVGFTEIIPIARMFNRLDKAGAGGLKRALIDASIEGAEEWIQEFGQQTAGNAIARQLYDENRGLFDESLPNGNAGGVSGVLASLMMTAVGRGRGGRPGAGESPTPTIPTPPTPEGGDTNVRQEMQGQGQQAPQVAPTPTNSQAAGSATIVPGPQTPPGTPGTVTAPDATPAQTEAPPAANAPVETPPPQKTFEFGTRKGEPVRVTAGSLAEATAQLPKGFKPAGVREVETVPTDNEDAIEAAAAAQKATQKPTAHEKSSTQVDVPPSQAKAFNEFAATISDADLYTAEPDYGRETQPHVTALYGITNSDIEPVKKALAGIGPIKARVGKVSLFENADRPYDVVKYDIDSPDLQRVNKALRENTEFESDFPDYKPHLTVAYVKKGAGKKYAGASPLTGTTLTFDSLTFSTKEGQKIQIPLSGPALGEGTSLKPSAVADEGARVGSFPMPQEPATSGAGSIASATPAPAGPEGVAAPVAPARQPVKVPPPAIERGKTTGEGFASVAIRAAKLKQNHRAAKFLSQFANRLAKGNRDALSKMEIHVRTQAEWDADQRTGVFTPDSAGAYDPDTNTLYLNSDKLDGENVASVIVHEAGHFAEQFALGEAFTQRQWESLDHWSRVKAKEQYDARASLDDDIETLRKDRRARAEWVAMQFARVVRGDTNGMQPTMLEKLKAWLTTVRELVKNWIGDAQYTTRELDAKILEFLGYNEDGTKAAPAAKTKPASPGTRTYNPDGSYYTEPATPKPASPASGVSAELQALGDELFGTPPVPGEFNRKFDPTKIETANKFVALLVREHPNVRSRGALAKFIDEKFPKARPFSDAVFRMMGGFVDLDESGTWAETYAPKKAEPTPAPASNKSIAERSVDAADALRARIKTGEKLDWREFFEITDQAFGGTRASGTYTVKDAYDALELAVNLHIVKDGILQDRAVTDEDNNIFKTRLAVGTLTELIAKLPTQTVRTDEQDQMQQFSTPPPFAFVANWVANLRGDDVYLEPSAGIAGLASFAHVAGVKRIIANELSDRRASLLKASGIPDVVTEHNAENLNAILDAAIRKGQMERPTVVVMNPPFSNAAYSGDRKRTMVGAQHVEEALKLLAPGGRLVAIVGEGMGFDRPTFRDWWKRIRDTYAVRANIRVDGKNYAKYGTTFDNRLLVIDKPHIGDSVAGAHEPVQGDVATFNELINLLSKGIRDERLGPKSKPESDTRPPAESAGAGGTSTERPDAGAGRPATGTTTGAVGAGQPEAAAAKPSGGKPRGPAGVRGPAVPNAGSDEGASAPGGRSPAGGRRPAAGTGEQAVGDAGRPADDAARAGRPDVALPESETVDITGGAANEQAPSSFSDSIFDDYSPRKVRIAGAKAHPSPLVESAAMASIDPPDVTYQPKLPKGALEGGAPSSAQVETVVYAGQAHQLRNPDGTRRGFFVGDGTGSGKGITSASIIIDNFLHGRKKAVWLSASAGLVKSAQGDFANIGMGDVDLVELSSIKAKTGTIENKSGVMFGTYSTLIGDLDSNRIPPQFQAGAIVKLSDEALAKLTPEAQAEARGNLTVTRVKIHPKHGVMVAARNAKGKEVDLGSSSQLTSVKAAPSAQKSRVDQLVEWFGKDYDGVIILDEAHKAGNAIDTEGGRGIKKASKAGRAVIELQDRLPNARVVYSSATGATEVSNLAYATRLGLWGTGTQFGNVEDFINQISAAGISAMEIVARDMKALGRYIARSLSWKEVKFDVLEHALSPEQSVIYDEIAEAWQIVLRNMNEALELTGGKDSPQAKMAARSAFFGAQQRFFNQILTAMHMPSVIKDAQQHYDAGHALIFQLTNTNASYQERAIDNLENAEDLETMDASPRDILLQYLDKSFPTRKFETVMDDNGNEVVRVVIDEQGKPVEDPEALAKKQALMDRVATLRIPDNPLDMILNTFGVDNVAEATGRSRRVVQREDDSGNLRKVIERHSPSHVAAQTQDFAEDKRRIVVFSKAGGTGYSYHADKRIKNQRKRYHYLVQAGWQANEAVQGLGRAHRSNQASAPELKLARTNLPGHRRFISTIARRLAQLGALTTGERRSTGQGLFKDSDNLENEYANAAVRSLYVNAFSQQGQAKDGNFSNIDWEIIESPLVPINRDTNIATVAWHILNGTEANKARARLQLASRDPTLKSEEAILAAAQELLQSTQERGGKASSLSWTALTEYMGFDGDSFIDADGKLIESKIPSVPQFLNRILLLKIADQNEVFSAFERSLEDNVAMAKARDEFDDGMQTLRVPRGGHIEKIEERVAFTDPESKQQTKLVEIERVFPTQFREYQAAAIYSDQGLKFYRNRRTGKVYAAYPSGQRTTTEGGVVRTYRRMGVTDSQQDLLDETDLNTTPEPAAAKPGDTFTIPYQGDAKFVEGPTEENGKRVVFEIRGTNYPYAVSNDLTRAYAQMLYTQTGRIIPGVNEHARYVSRGTYDEIPGDQAKAAWEEAMSKADPMEHHRDFFLVGILLPIWKRLNLATPQVFRFETNQGERMLGVRVPSRAVERVLRNLGIAEGSVQLTPETVFGQVYTEGITFPLSNGWKLARVTVGGQQRIEIVGVEPADFDRLDEAGAFKERIGFKPRYFVPTEADAGTRVLEAILKYAPVVQSTGPLGTPALRDQHWDTAAVALTYGKPRGAPGLSVEKHQGNRAIVWRDQSGHARGVIHYADTGITHMAMFDRYESMGLAEHMADFARSIVSTREANGDFSPSVERALRSTGFKVNGQGRGLFGTPAEGGSVTAQAIISLAKELDAPLFRSKVEQAKAFIAREEAKGIPLSARLQGDQVTLAARTVLEKHSDDPRAKRLLDDDAGLFGTPPVVKGTAAQETIGQRVTGTLEDNRSLFQKFGDFVAETRDYIETELKQKLVDRFASIRRLEKAILGNADIDASASAYKFARLTGNLASVMEYLLRDGPLAYAAGSMTRRAARMIYDDGAGVHEEYDPKGLLEILKPLTESGKTRLWEYYVAAYRANRLMAEGREQNFQSQAEINELLALGTTHPEFETIRRQYVAFNRSMLDMAQASGLISAAQRATWEKADYVPFYRIMDGMDGKDAKGPYKRRGIANQRSGVRRLKGGENAVAVLENIYRNLETLVDASFKNIAMQRVADLAGVANGLITPIPYQAVPFKTTVAEAVKLMAAQGIPTAHLTQTELEDLITFWRARAPQGKNVVSVMDQGKARYFRVNDAPLLRSILAMGPDKHAAWMKMLMAPKRILTNLVTLDPAFMVANTIRDSLSAWVISASPIRPGIDSAIGMVKALRHSDSRMRIMAAGGGSGHYNRLTETEVRKQFVRMTPDQKKSFTDSILDSPGKVWRAIKDLSRATENANRIAIFDSAKKRGASDAEAAFQALDIMDFGLRGDSKLLGFFLDTVPFLNARLQGLYKLGRASGIGQGDGLAKLLPHRRFATHAAMIVGGSLALLALNWDNEDYWDLQEWDRDQYYHLWLAGKHYRIPKPFEVGQAFSTVPERMVETASRTGDTGLLMQRILSMVRDTFAFNPLPQAIKPIAERAANINTFTGSPILSEGDRFRAPEQQYGPLTSETVRAMAEAMPDSAPEWMRSPKTLEHFVRGYFGTLGMQTLNLTDALVREAGDYPEQPSGRPGDFWMVGRFAPEDEGKSTKYVGQFYEMHREIMALREKAKTLRESGDLAEAAAIEAENRDLLTFAPQAQSTYKTLQSIRQRQNQVYESRTLAPEQKREQLTRLGELRNRTARATMDVNPRRTAPFFNPFSN